MSSFSLRSICTSCHNSNIRRALVDMIYVFTPEGHIIDFPHGSTPLDFAYRVHTEVGHRCRGAKVNGRPAAPRFELVVVVTPVEEPIGGVLGLQPALGAAQRELVVCCGGPLDLVEVGHVQVELVTSMSANPAALTHPARWRPASTTR